MSNNKKDEFVQPELPAMPPPSPLDSMVEEPEEAQSQSLVLPTRYSSEPEFGQDEIYIPMLRLAQGLTAEVANGDARPGDWILTGYPVLKDVTIVPLAFARRRERSGLDGNSKRIVICRSNNAQHGEGDPGGDCNTCPHAVFGGACDLIYNYKIYVVEHKTLALIQFKRTSMRVAKTINTMSMQRGFGRFAIRLTGQKQDGKKGPFFVAAMTPADVDPSIFDEARNA